MLASLRCLGPRTETDEDKVRWIALDSIDSARDSSSVRCAEPSTKGIIVTTQSGRKANIRLFAGTNGLNYTSALRQFASSGEDLLVETRTSDPGPDAAAELAWADARGLTAGPRSGCFHALASDSGLAGRGHRYSYREDCSFLGSSHVRDHLRTYQYRGPNDSRRRLAVVTFAPYADWKDPKVLASLAATADEFDVAYRIGMAKDATYGSGTVPVVFWNPRVIDLP